MKTVNGLRAQACLVSTSLTLLLSPGSNQGLAANADAAFLLYAKPSICVSYNTDESCTMALELRWKGPVGPELCVHELLRNPALQCWQGTGAGSLKLNFANTVDVQYLLEEADTSATVAAVTVKVINRDLRSSRTRRRHIWSLL